MHRTTGVAAFIGSILLIVLSSGCAPSTFIVSKDGRAYYLGRDSAQFRKMLCDSGDLKAVLAESHIADEIKADLYRYQCSDERSEPKTVSLFHFMTPDEVKELKRAFIRYDYVVNFVPC